MGSGYHGGFGATKGSSKVYRDGYQKNYGINYTREQLIDFLDGKTAQSSEIAIKMIWSPKVLAMTPITSNY